MALIESSSFLRGMLNQFSQWFANRKKFSQVFRVEIWSSLGGSCSLAADLNNCDHFSINKNRRTDDFLNRRSRQPIGFDGFKNPGLANPRKIIDDLRPAGRPPTSRPA